MYFIYIITSFHLFQIYYTLNIIYLYFLNFSLNFYIYILLIFFLFYIFFSTLDMLPSTLDMLPSTLDFVPSTLDLRQLDTLIFEKIPNRFATSDSAAFVFNYSIFFLFVCMLLFVDCLLIGSLFQQLSQSITTTPQKIEIQNLALPEES